MTVEAVCSIVGSAGVHFRRPIYLIRDPALQRQARVRLSADDIHVHMSGRIVFQIAVQWLSEDRRHLMIGFVGRGILIVGKVRGKYTAL
jgi:hypothetical protein